jgi:hypothetical protein
MDTVKYLMEPNGMMKQQRQPNNSQYSNVPNAAKEHSAMDENELISSD